MGRPARVFEVQTGRRTSASTYGGKHAEIRSPYCHNYPRAASHRTGPRLRPPRRISPAVAVVHRLRGPAVPGSGRGVEGSVGDLDGTLCEFAADDVPNEIWDAAANASTALEIANANILAAIEDLAAQVGAVRANADTLNLPPAG